MLFGHGVSDSLKELSSCGALMARGPGGGYHPEPQLRRMREEGGKQWERQRGVSRQTRDTGAGGYKTAPHTVQSSKTGPHITAH
jgi:hypothetical protein